MSVAQKLFFHPAISIFILLSSNNVLPFDIQVDSTIKKSDVPIKIIDQDLLIIPDYLFSPENDRPYINHLHDLLNTPLNKDYLNQRLNSNYIFQSSLSEQWRINEQLTNYIQFKKELALKSDLGVFGKMLYQAKNLTAIILAILHVIKYKKGLY